MTEAKDSGGLEQLTFTDRLLLAALWFALLIANSGIFWRDLQQTGLKHAVGVIALAAGGLYMLSQRIARPQWPKLSSKALFAWAWLFLLSIYIIVGSIYARIVLDFDETFLIVGLYILIGGSYALCLRRDNTIQVARHLFLALLVFAVLIALDTIHARAVDFSVKDTVIHEREFLVIPLLYLLTVENAISRKWRWIVAIVIVGASFAAMKNTPTIVLAVTVAAIAWRLAFTLRSRGVQPIRMYAAVYATLLCSLVLVAGYYYYSSTVIKFTPPGNIDFRLHQYEVAWKEFQEAPVFGKFFTGETGIDFSLWADPRFGGTALPTHSDVLDLLRGGGAVAFLLWFTAITIAHVRAVLELHRARREHRWREGHDLLTWLVLTNLSAVVVYSFNPLLAKTGLALMIWICYGLMIAMTERVRVEIVE